MRNSLKIALRNLLRYRRRTFFTLGLITVGMVFVFIFVSATGSFKDMMVRNITDSYLGHIQIHAKGYVESIENLPLQLNLQPRQVATIEEVVNETQLIDFYSKRIKFGGAFSNFEQTTNIRLNDVDPEAETRTEPLLLPRLVAGERTAASLARGKIFVPELLTKGLGVKIGDTVVVVATNRDGSVNGKTFVIGGILASATGPGGRDGYIHIDDARELLRMPDGEISEIAIRLKNLSELQQVSTVLQSKLTGAGSQSNLEIHTWEKLSPFFNLFLYEGLLLGVLGSLLGTMVGLLVIAILNSVKITFSFGQQEGVVLAPTIAFSQVIIISALVVGVSLLATLQPAWKASRMEPIDALQHI
ncbi:MAG: ABC transporter permease [Acidobacteria bacterium]|nr:ABC transporter permease [Acidobacteriota bacterium]